MSSVKSTILIVFLLLIIAFLQYRLWFDAAGLKDLIQLKRSVQEKISENDNLKKRNEELLLQIKEMQNNKDTTEARARNELGMIKKGEVFYQIVK